MLVAAIVAAAVGAAGLARDRSLTNNTMFTQAVLVDGGRALRIGGLVGCERRQPIKIVARVTQRQTAAYAIGTFTGTCRTGTQGRWAVTVRATGRDRFRVGPAEGVALAIPRKDGRRTDAHQWLKDLQVVKP